MNTTTREKYAQSRAHDPSLDDISVTVEVTDEEGRRHRRRYRHRHRSKGEDGKEGGGDSSTAHDDVASNNTNVYATVERSMLPVEEMNNSPALSKSSANGERSVGGGSDVSIDSGAVEVDMTTHKREEELEYDSGLSPSLAADTPMTSPQRSHLHIKVNAPSSSPSIVVRTRVTSTSGHPSITSSPLPPRREVHIPIEIQVPGYKPPPSPPRPSTYSAIDAQRRCPSFKQRARPAYGRKVDDGTLVEEETIVKVTKSKYEVFKTLL